MRSLDPVLASLLLANVVTVPVSIMEIQGRGHASLHLGHTVTTRGVVTVSTAAGFYLQDAAGDGDDATSDAIFVYMPPANTTVPGDRVEVDAVVREYLPGGDTENLTVTELHAVALRTLASGQPLPVAVVIGASGRRPPTETIDDDAFTVYEPERDGIDFYESLEGMRVRLAGARVVGPTNPFGETWVTVTSADDRAGGRGGLAAADGDANPERIQIDDGLLAVPMPLLDAGAHLDDVVGVVDYRHGNYEVLALSAPAAHGNALARETTTLGADAHHITVATLNAHNLAPDDASHVTGIADLIVGTLGAPDVVALQEIQDGSGTRDDGTVDARATYDALTRAIQDAGGPAYAARDVPPIDGADGGAPGGNIRVALLYNPARVSFAARGETESELESFAAVDDTSATLTRSPGLVSPRDPAWDASRKPLAGEFRFGAARFFVVVCHFTSKTGTSPWFGAIQPPVDARAEKRRHQARLVRAFVESLLALDPRARVIVLGDFNDDWFARPLTPLHTSPALFDLSALLDPVERYSYLFEGNGHLYDRVFVSPGLIPGARVDIVHAASEFVQRVTDHDALVARVAMNTRTEGPVAVAAPPAYPNPFRDSVTLALTGAGAALLRAHVFDVHGRRVRELAPGTDTVTWDARDERGRRVPAGVYFVRVCDGENVITHKVVRVDA